MDIRKTSQELLFGNPFFYQCAMNTEKKMQEEQLPALAQVSQFQFSWPLSMQNLSLKLKLMCVPHTDVDMCQGDRAPRYFFFPFSYQVSAHPECEVTNQLFVPGVLCCFIFNAALKTEVILECMPYPLSSEKT